jgi:hypothetical protein
LHASIIRPNPVSRVLSGCRSPCSPRSGHVSGGLQPAGAAGGEPL